MTPTRRVASYVTAVFVLVTAFAMLSSRPAAAHAVLVGSDPVADAVVGESPPTITLTFSEPVDLPARPIRVVSAAGVDVAVGTARQPNGSNSLSVPPAAPLDDGTFVVVWTVVSKDSHTISGAYTFSVGKRSSSDPALADRVADGTRNGSGWPLGAGRFASFAGAGVLIGALVVGRRLASGGLVTRGVDRLVVVGSTVGALGTAVMIGVQATRTGRSATDWSAVVATTSGRWWLARAVAFIAVVPLLAVVRRVRSLDRHAPLLIGIGLSGVIAAGGHAVTGRFRFVGFAATVVHLAAMAVWMGGIVALLVLSLRGDRWRAAAAFSPVALGAVSALALSGAVNGWRQLGSLSALTGSTYGRWLVVKLVVVALVVLAAAANRWLVRRGESVAWLSDPAAALRSTVSFEALGMTFVLAATAGLVDSPPPRDRLARPVSVSIARDGRIAQIDLDPAVTGGTTMHVTITSNAGSLEQPDEITVSATLPTRALGPLEVVTFDAGPGHVTTPDARFPVAGRWKILVTARYGDFDQVEFVADLDVSARP